VSAVSEPKTKRQGPAAGRAGTAPAFGRARNRHRASASISSGTRVYRGLSAQAVGQWPPYNGERPLYRRESSILCGGYRLYRCLTSVYGGGCPPYTWPRELYGPHRAKPVAVSALYTADTELSIPDPQCPL
jgi:hypothetical protein